MKKLKESELAENLLEFQDINLELEFDNDITGTIKMDKGSVFFNDNDGYIYIKSERGNLKINTTLVTRYEKIENKISIKFETIELGIKKCRTI